VERAYQDIWPQDFYALLLASHYPDAWHLVSQLHWLQSLARSFASIQQVSHVDEEITYMVMKCSPLTVQLGAAWQVRKGITQLSVSEPIEIPLIAKSSPLA